MQMRYGFKAEICIKILGVAYQFMSKKHCNEHRYGSFSSSQEAKQRCSEDRSCKGVYVKSCDQSDGVHLCYKGYSYDSSSYSCVYNKLSGIILSVDIISQF